MKSLADITSQVEQILQTKWVTRSGRVIPEPSSVKLGNDAVIIDGAVLYADLSDSTELVKGYKNWFAAEVYKCYLMGCCEIIKNNYGVVTSFDGDRVMAVYIGEDKESWAAKTALQINYFVSKVLNPKIKKFYPDVKWIVQQAVGVDVCNLFVARTGVRGDNDLVWVGNAANIAAKMCGIRVGTSAAYITRAVLDKLSQATRFGGDPKRQMWEAVSWEQQNITVYKSGWTWEIG